MKTVESLEGVSLSSERMLFSFWKAVGREADHLIQSESRQTPEGVSTIRAFTIWGLPWLLRCKKSQIKPRIFARAPPPWRPRTLFTYLSAQHCANSSASCFSLFASPAWISFFISWPAPQTNGCCLQRENGLDFQADCPVVSFSLRSWLPPTWVSW